MRKVLMVSLLLLVFVLASCKKEGRNITVPREEQFIVGMEANYAPFNWTEDFATPYNYPINNFKGKYADGYDVQIAKAIAASLGKVLVIEKLDWDALIPNLEIGKIDAIIAGMSPLPERQESVSFTEEYYHSYHVILVLADGDYANGNTLSSFAGATFVGQQGTTYDQLIDQLTGVNHGTALENVPDILTGILGGRIDGTVLEYPVAKGIIMENDEFSLIELETGFEAEQVELMVSVAVRLDETDLVNDINAILNAIPLEVRNKLMDQAILRNAANKVNEE